ncbi:MAG: YfiR family protein [Vicinamibacterales bacterium]
MNATPRWLLVVAIALLGVPAVPRAQSASDEYRLKAAFVYRFPQFVEWPAAAVRDARTLDVCVLHPNPFGTDLEQMAMGESVGGRVLRVRIVTMLEELDGCHALFAGGHNEATAAALKAVEGLPVLTVGEDDRFLDEGGIIALKVVERRVRFDVDATHARRAGLRISAQLLSLAAAVRGGTE